MRDSSFANTWTGIFHQNTGVLSVTGSEFLGPGVGVALAGGLGPDVTVQNSTFSDCVEAMFVEPDSGGNRLDRGGGWSG